MRQVIEQDILEKIVVINDNDEFITLIDLLGDNVCIDKKGAQQLVVILQKFLENNNV